MRKMFLLFSHKLTPLQIEDAKKSLGIKEFIDLPKELQELWSNIPAEIKTLNEYLIPLKKYLQYNVIENDIVLIQGDFGGTYHMVEFCKQSGLTAVHSTTKREVKEVIKDSKVIKTSTFEHVIFRGY